MLQTEKLLPLIISKLPKPHKLLLGSLCTAHQLQDTDEGLCESDTFKKIMVPQEKANHNNAVQQ